MFALFIPALVGALAVAMGSFIGRAIIALGIGFVTYKGIDLSLGAMKQLVVSSVQGMPVDAVNLIGYLWIDKGISVIISAITISIAFKGIGGSVKKAVLK